MRQWHRSGDCGHMDEVCIEGPRLILVIELPHVANEYPEA